MHGRNTNTSNSGSSNGEGCGVVMRKGPWVAEEDEILLEYVRKHGPRDWSSIRSKGLLPRTGKSCRLRWVNKLKPDLKTGCKFSAEEERIVIDLQGRFGNKWARIATYLPGRTDNDVKNFWSTRQKRLARLLQTPLQPNSKSSKSHGKLAVPNHAPTFEVASLDLIPYGEESSSGQCSQTDFMDNPDAREMVQMTPHLENHHHQGLLFNMDPTLPLLEPSVDQEVLLPQLHFDHLPNPEFDFPSSKPRTIFRATRTSSSRTNWPARRHHAACR
uniref:R2R3 MYB DUO1-like protein n=1 Tax=Iris fulva TaxID=92176 RepID=K9LXH9_9ASPA